MNVIILNPREDYKDPRIYSKNINKGRVINNIYIIDDIVDSSLKDRGNRKKMLCKCLLCGRIFIYPIRKFRKKGIYCFCQKGVKSEKFRYKKIELINIIRKEMKLVEDEAITEDDYKRIDDLRTVYNFLRSDSLNNYFLKSPIDKESEMWYSKQGSEK